MSYIQDLHSERSVQQFVNIIGKIDFTGNIEIKLQLVLSFN